MKKSFSFNDLSASCFYTSRGLHAFNLCRALWESFNVLTVDAYNLADNVRRGSERPAVARRAWLRFYRPRLVSTLCRLSVSGSVLLSDAGAAWASESIQTEARGALGTLARLDLWHASNTETAPELRALDRWANTQN